MSNEEKNVFWEAYSESDEDECNKLSFEEVIKFK